MSQEVMNNVIAEFNKVIEDYNRQKLEFNEKMKKSLHQAFKDFFAQNPNFPIITWTQYTPYFNDGEPCVFSRHDICVGTAKEYELWKEGDIDHYDFHYLSYAEPKRLYHYDDDFDGIPEDEIKRVTEFLATLEKIPEETYEELFGDHVQVIVTAEGIDVQDYEHD